MVEDPRVGFSADQGRLGQVGPEVADVPQADTRLGGALPWCLHAPARVVRVADVVEEARDLADALALTSWFLNLPFLP